MPEPDLRIDCTLAPQINFACHQNDVPLVRDLSVTNNTHEEYSDLILSLMASPAFVSPKTWTIDRIPSGGTIHITDRDTHLGGQFLLGLKEAMRGTLTLTLQRGEQVIAVHKHELEVLARNEWGGYGTSPELLAAFAMPNDLAVERLLRTASKALREAGLKPEMDGYQGHSRKRVWEQASAIWSGVVGMRLDYSYPPASFEKTGQKVRTPSMIVETGRATCLDTTLLFCAALEQAGLRSVIVLKEGHSYAGVWLQPEGFAQTLTDDVVAVRKRVDLKELILFETTLVTKSPAVSFNEAVGRGRDQVSEEEGADFQYLLDLYRARAKRIRPLDFVEAADPPADTGEDGDRAILIDQAPKDLPDFGEDVPVETPTTPRGRLDQWQRKLLDLTLRNPLLNYRSPKASVAVIAPDPAALEDSLAHDAVMEIQPLPTLSSPNGRDAELHQQRTGYRLDEEYAREGLEHDRIYARLDKSQLEERLIRLYRKAKADLEEGGANTLFMAMGFLKWQREDKGDRVFRAPLVLVPIEIKRQSVRSSIKIKLHDDEPRFNTTLLEMLRQDFRLDVKGLEGPLPTDESGVDVIGIWNKLKHEVRDVSGFEVSEEVVLGTFSFAKYLMWKDLVDRIDQLKENSVVRHLLETPQQNYATDVDFPVPTKLDADYHTSEIFTPLDTDSSQLAAILAASEGKDFVMIGPPGTGKSQTIANMITQNLANGRTVLFVSEKAAALNVVYRRLKKIGLGEFCLELHSNKTRKLDVLAQLRHAWDARAELSTELWKEKAEHLRQCRDHLNDYVRRLHQRHRNGWSLHAALGQVVANPDAPDLDFEWASPDAHDREALERFREVARRIDINLGEVGHLVDHSLKEIHASDWSVGWQQQLIQGARSLGAVVEDLRRSVDELAETLDVDLDALSFHQVDKLVAYCKALRRSAGQTLGFAFSERAQAVLKASNEALNLIRRYREIESGLSCSYAAQAWRKLDLDDLADTWDRAGNRRWPISALLRARVRKVLRKEGEANGKPDPGKDLGSLTELADLGSQIDARDKLLQEVADWNGFDTDVARFAEVKQVAEALRTSSAGLMATPAKLTALREKARALVVEANEILGPEGAVGQVLAQTQAKAETFREHLASFTRLAGGRLGPHIENDQDCLRAIADLCERVEDHQSQLNAWCAWRRVRDEAIALGIGALVHAIEDGVVNTGESERTFLTAYCRWWVAQVVDRDDVLRKFVSAEHEARVREFKDLDDVLRELAAQYVRARSCGQLPDQDEISRRSEFGVLKRELEKKRGHKPLRKLITELPTALPQLTPCLLMSPLSIAQYLSTDHQKFDVVIFDEASQITVYDAVGAIARGRQTIVAGDPKQLPPTNFFARQADDDEVFEDDIGDLESILDEMLGARIPKLELEWHYRSENENLITFSNHRYYNGNLITSPAATTTDDSVKFRFVGGTYERGGNRTNRAEAEAIVSEIIDRLKKVHKDGPDIQAPTPSMGVVTFNSEQQMLIENLLDEARRSNPELEGYFSDDRLEPVFVKNLESVQGDERDVILFSITYGPDKTGAIHMNFGPLNNDGGQRRLNVAITRARREMLVFSSIRGEQIDLSRSNRQGVIDLKHFLEFAERGPKALSEATFGPKGDFESPFEAAVARALRNRGWQLHLQVGVSTFRIDLGVVHPEAPGRYLAAVECDGATYHRAATARDRDKVREAILTRLGWRILRIWSTDFWLNPEGTIDKLDAGLKELLEEDRKDAAAGKVDKEMGEGDKTPTFVMAEMAPDRIQKIRSQSKQDSVESPVIGRQHRQVAMQTPPTSEVLTTGTYRVVDTNDLTLQLDSGAFYEPNYLATLDELIEIIVCAEGPILDENLVKRVSNHHGFKRAGRRIQERVLWRARQKCPTTRESIGTFFWPPGMEPQDWNGCRLPARDADFRAPNEIPIQELLSLAKACRFEEDPPVSMARILGIARLSAQHRHRLVEALNMVRELSDGEVETST